MGSLGFFENMINQKLLSLHTAYLAKVLSVNGNTAKIQPLGMTQGYNEKAQAQSVLTNVPIACQKLKNHTYTVVTDPYPNARKTQITVAQVEPLKAGDIVVCVCCERDITEAKKGKNAVPPIGHHSMSDSVIIGVLEG